jgi:hypothetical protein
MVTAARSHHDLHDMVDQLSPDQADAVRAMLRLIVAPREEERRGIEEDRQPRRRLSFAATLSAEPDFAERSEEILDEIVRNAG